MKITAWAKAGGLPECPYFRIWILQAKRWSLRIHRWYADDDHRAFHDHPHWFITFVLWGGYTDVTEIRPQNPIKNRVERHEKLRGGSIRFRPANHRHSVQDVLPGTVTLLLTGRSFHRIQFWIDGKGIGRDTYFATRGHHPCLEGELPVRIRPDGSRIVKKEKAA